MTSAGAITGGNGPYNIEIDELKFFKLLSNVLNPLPSSSLSQSSETLDWLLSLDLYYLLHDSSPSLSDQLSFREFAALVFVLSAAHSGTLLKCLFDHGALLFDIVGAGQPVITGERMRVLGERVLGIIDEVMDSVFEAHGLSYKSMCSFEDFQVYYFEVFSKVDESVRERQLEKERKK